MKNNLFTGGEIQRLGLMKRTDGRPQTDRGLISRLINRLPYVLVKTPYGTAKCLSGDQLKAYNEALTAGMWLPLEAQPKIDAFLDAPKKVGAVLDAPKLDAPVGDVVVYFAPEKLDASLDASGDNSVDKSEK